MRRHSIEVPTIVRIKPGALGRIGLSGQRWVVPFGAGGGRIVRIGKLPLNISAAAYYNVVHPDIGPL